MKSFRDIRYVLKLLILFLGFFDFCGGRAKTKTTSDKVPLLTYNLTCDNSTHYCYQAFTSRVKYSQAWYNCHALGMHLAMPRTQQQIDFVRNSILGTGDHESVWIGLVANETVDYWMWQDYKDLADTGVTSWKTGQPSKARRKRAAKGASKGGTTSVNAHCVQTSSNGWSNDDCAATYQYMCQTYTKGCSEESPYVFGDKCYQLVTANTTASTSLCPTGSMLAMPKTDQINNYTYNINYRGVSMWIGLYRPQGDEDIPFQWMDGDNITKEYLTKHVTHESVIERDDEQPDLYVYMISSGFWNTAYFDERSDLSFICEYQRDITDCGTLTIPNGNAISQNTTEGNVHDVTCDNGYISPSSSVSCQADGNWSPAPICSIDCGTLTIPNGNTISQNTFEGKVHDVTCDNGYISSSTSVTCQADGSWSPAPICIIDCGKLTIQNGNTISQNTSEGNFHDVICDNGYVASTCSVTCQADGNWYPAPVCNFDEDAFCECKDYTESNKSLDAIVKEIIRNLTVDRSTLSRTRRKLSSAEDDRTSSRCLGWLGILIMSIFCSVLVINDLINVFLKVKDH